MTSKCEGMPNALMEAMALGLPVISTDCPCGGPHFLIRDGENGLLVPSEDGDALVEAIRKVLNNPVLASHLGRKATEIAETLAPQKIYKMWGDYINDIVLNREQIEIKKDKNLCVEDKKYESL